VNLAILPVLIPLVSGVVFLLWGHPSRSRRIVATLSAAAQLVVALWLIGITIGNGGTRIVLALGGWPAPYGITLVIDGLAALMVGLSTFTALAAFLFTWAERTKQNEHPLRVPLLQFIVTGINLSFVTGDLFNLFVAFEIMLIASYALLTLEADDWDVKQAFPYLTINVFGSTLFLCAAGLTYGLFGTLNLAEIAMAAPAYVDDLRFQLVAALLLLVFAIKAGLFPLYFWLPGSYPTLPVPVAALFSGMLTKVGVYTFIRFTGTVFPHDMEWLHISIAWIAGATMVFGVMGAIAQNYVRGILSYHILSQIGFMALAIGFFTPLSIAASIFYIVHHIIVKSALFLAGGVAGFLNKTDDLTRMGGIWKLSPLLGILFLFQAMSLAGIPPLSGFWGKYMIIVVGVEQQQYVLVAASLVASLLTLFSMLKIWNGAFWQPGKSGVAPTDLGIGAMLAVLAGMVCVSLFIGLGAEIVFQAAEISAEQVLDQQGYAAAVQAAGELPTPKEGY